MVKKTKVYYCEKCGQWRGSNKQCTECKSEAVERELPQARGDYYFIPGIDKPLPRVTNILRILDKPGLNYWKTKVVAEAALADPTLSLLEVMAATTRVKDEAGANGSEIHKIIAGLSNGQEIDWQTVSKTPHLQAYLKFQETVPHQVLNSEMVVYSRELEYAGTLDALIQTYSTAIVAGKEKVAQAQKQGYEVAEKAGPLTQMKKKGGVWLVDYKTSNGVYNDAFLQLSAYKHALEEMKPGTRIDGLAIVHLQKDGSFAFVEGQDSFGVFEAVLKVYRWMT